MQLAAGAPSLHMSFTGNPGTGKTTVALRMADMLHKLGYSRTRSSGRGHARRPRRPVHRPHRAEDQGSAQEGDGRRAVHRRGVLPLPPENERDYGQEAIEILLQVMENHRDDLVVILAGYKDRMETFFRSNPGMSSRIAHHIDFPDYTDDELLAIGELILKDWNYTLSPRAQEVFHDYIERRRAQPHFANARSVRNALDRARLRQARSPARRAAAASTRPRCRRSRPRTSCNRACSPACAPCRRREGARHERRAARTDLRRRRHARRHRGIPSPRIQRDVRRGRPQLVVEPRARIASCCASPADASACARSPSAKIARRPQRADFDELLIALHAAKTRRYDASLREEPLPLRPGIARLFDEAAAEHRVARDRDDDDRGESRRAARTAFRPQAGASASLRSCPAARSSA